MQPTDVRSPSSCSAPRSCAERSSARMALMASPTERPEETELTWADGAEYDGLRTTARMRKAGAVVWVHEGRRPPHSKGGGSRGCHDAPPGGKDVQIFRGEDESLMR